MKKTLVVCSSNRLMEDETSAVVNQLLACRAGYIEMKGINDVCLARNLSLTQAWNVVQQGDHDVVLMIDDDMSFKLRQAQQIVDHVRGSKLPASGAYLLSDGRLAATPFGRLGSNPRIKLHQTGLGFLAIPAKELIEAARKSRRFRSSKTAKDWTFEFCTSGPIQWENELLYEPEDYSLSRKLGGVQLLPIMVGHIKKRTLLPDPEMVKNMLSVLEDS